MTARDLLAEALCDVLDEKHVAHERTADKLLATPAGQQLAAAAEHGLAWAAVVAALPEGWHFQSLIQYDPGESDAWTAEAVTNSDTVAPGEDWSARGIGDTPAAALTALAAALSERP